MIHNDMEWNRENFLKLLNDRPEISTQQINNFTKLIDQGSYYEYALDEIGLNNAEILDLKSSYFGIAGKHVVKDEIDPELLKNIPQKTIERHKVIPLKLDGRKLVIGFVNPGSLDAREAVDFIASSQAVETSMVVITQVDFDLAQGNLDNLSTEVDSALTELESEIQVAKDDVAAEIMKATSSEEANAAPVTKIVATIIKHANENNASDIHIEPYESETRVRFRVDGALIQSLVLPAVTHPALVARVKILANLRIDEKRKPQDGRFSAHIDKHKIDFRVSTFPTSHGEKVVMRLLDSERNVLTLDQLDMSERNLNLIRSAINEPFGLILISGPTGSGKSTTLYSMLQEVDRKTKNVLSLEDPVEYEIDGVSQSSINADIGYTFASGLRTTLRQDPDVIMVGEIRDKETAQLAIQASLTGHLVLSTIHTNSATGVIPRLVDMGVDPYLIAPSLKLAMGQRLVKGICPGTGKELPIEGAIRRMIDEEFKDLPLEYRKDIDIPRYVLQAQPSARCPKGTSGRLAVLEVMAMTPKIEQILLEDPNENKIYEAARADGMITMREDGFIKAFQHKIPFEEVNKLGTGLFGD